jgi:hypothetical protein
MSIGSVERLVCCRVFCPADSSNDPVTFLERFDGTCPPKTGTDSRNEKRLLPCIHIFYLFLEKNGTFSPTAGGLTSFFP